MMLSPPYTSRASSAMYRRRPCIASVSLDRLDDLGDRLRMLVMREIGVIRAAIHDGLAALAPVSFSGAALRGGHPAPVLRPPGTCCGALSAPTHLARFT